MPKTCDIAVLGGGAHGRVVVAAIRLIQPFWKVVVLDPNPSRLGNEIFGAVVLGGDEWFENLLGPGNRVPFAVGVGGIEDLSLRKRVYEFAIAKDGLPMLVVHPGASVSPFARLEDGAQVFTGAVVNPGALVGTNAIINTGAIIEHDCVVGAHAHVATNATLCGGVTVGERAFLGAGSVVRQGLTIGARALVGAGAVVVRDVEPDTIVAGVPARTLPKKGN
ncbi:MAG: acetyltransferase [Deltaproteobacteria bacterium]|nr:acetyltransferase [Deltaproteobacteria bacterium]